MSKEKLLFINGHLKVGGCERSLVDVLCHLNYDRYDVDLLLLEEYGDYLEELPKQVHVLLYELKNSFGPLWEVVVRALQNRDWFSLRFRFLLLLSGIFCDRLLHFAKTSFKELAQSYDVVIAYRPGICTDLAAFMLDGKKKISWWHHGEMLFSGQGLEQLRRSYQKMDVIVAVSNSSGALVRKSFPELEDRVTVIPNMICTEELLHKANAYEVKMNADCMNIVSIGRMSHEKNMALCPRIGKVLQQKGLFFHWYLIGDGEEFSKIENMIQEMDLHKDFSLLGRINNPYPYIKAAFVLVHPSQVESQGITVLEGLSLKTPVVVVSSEGTKEYMHSGENGVVTGSEPTEIANVIIELSKNSELRRRIAEKGFETADVFSPARIINKIERLLYVN